MFVCSHALLISCSHVYSLWRLYALTSTFLDDHLLLHSHLLKFTYFYVHILCWWSYTSMFTCFDNRLLHCQHALKRSYSLSYMPKCSYAWTLFWLDSPMLSYFFEDHMFRWSYFPRLHTLLLLKFQARSIRRFHYYNVLYSNALIITFTSGIDIHSYDIHTYAHTLGC